jgi:hypothetical protein
VVGENYYLFMNYVSHLPQKIDSLNCFCHNDSPSSSLFSETQGNLLGYGSPVASIRDDKLPPLEHHRTCSLVQLESAKPKVLEQFPLECPRQERRKWLGSWGAMELQHNHISNNNINSNSASFERGSTERERGSTETVGLDSNVISGKL